MRNEPEGEEGESGFLIENLVRDLLNREINFDENILGNRWLERRTFGVIVGPSGIGKSMVAIQMAIQAAAGLPVFGMATAHPLRLNGDRLVGPVTKPRSRPRVRDSPPAYDRKSTPQAQAGGSGRR